MVSDDTRILYIDPEQSVQIRQYQTFYLIPRLAFGTDCSSIAQGNFRNTKGTYLPVVAAVIHTFVETSAALQSDRSSDTPENAVPGCSQSGNSRAAEYAAAHQ